MDTSNININYNILREFIKSIVSHYMDDYDEKTADMERAVGDGKDDKGEEYLEDDDEVKQEEKSSNDVIDDEEKSHEQDNYLEKKNDNNYKNYSFIDYIVNYKTDKFIISNIDNLDKIKINDFEKKLKHMKISNLEKIKLLLCALWSMGYKEKNLETIFNKNIYISSNTTYNNDKQLELIINEFNNKFDNSIQDPNLFRLYLIHNCIL